MTMVYARIADKTVADEYFAGHLDKRAARLPPRRERPVMTPRWFPRLHADHTVSGVPIGRPCGPPRRSGRFFVEQERPITLRTLGRAACPRTPGV